METFETYAEVNGYIKRHLIQDEPVCSNGNVRVRKYRITIELVDEPDEVIKARIQKMWDECKNHHHWQPLKAEAKKYGLELRHGPKI